MTSTRRRAAVPALIVGLLVLLLAVLPGLPARADSTPQRLAAAPTDVNVDQIAQALRSDPVYVAPGAENLLPSDQADQVRDEIKGADHTSVFVAVVPDSAAPNDRAVDQLVPAIGNALGEDGVYAVVNSTHIAAGATKPPLPAGEAAQLASQAAQENNGGSVADVLTDFVKLSDKAAANPGEPVSTDSGGGFPVALIVLLVIVVGGVGLYGFSRYKRRQREAEQLEQVRHAADEDVTRLGEDIAGLDLDIARPGLDEATRSDYSQALDSYDTAKRRLADARRPEDMRGVTEALEDGRYAMTCVRARLDGKPVPERRPPCFFNPQHGPSVIDMDWAPMGGAQREVPVCAACATRLNHGEDPEARQVLVDGVRRPYWEAGPAYAPWLGGYYGGYGMGGLLPGLFMGTMLGSALGGGWGMGGYGYGGDFGGGDFGGDGGGDFGGGDFGGGFGDFGGGDFGGGDFGGGDF